MDAQSITLLSIYTGLIGFTLLTAFFVYGLVRHITGRAALAASAVTAGWYASLAGFGMAPVSEVLELSAYLAWFLFLARILGVSPRRFRDKHYRKQTQLALGGIAVYLVGVVVILVAGGAAPGVAEASPVAWFKLLLCLLGLVFVEQVARNTRRDFMWRLKFMSLGLGTLFAYGFILHADTVLFGAVSAVLFIPQGFVFSLAVPMIAIASVRNPVNRLNFSVSRQFAFRSGVLVLTGSYLIITGAAGYYVRLFGGEWGDVFFVLVLVAGIVGLLILALSTRVQGALRIALKRNLYEYKYDYREEWLRVSAELTGPGREDSLEERAIHAVGELVQSGSGVVFRVTDQDVLVPIGQINAPWAVPLSSNTTLELKQFFLQGEERIVDLDAYRDDPAPFAGLDLSSDDAALSSARFLVPLCVGDQLFGMLALGQPSVAMTLDWEDYDTLKVVARQAAGFLALKNADEALSASEQFRVRQELSAFVVHDLKTISGQLTLMLRNAKRHRDNPAFVDDLLTTVENAAGRMDHLLAQLRDPGKTNVPPAETEVLAIIRSIIEERSPQLPVPSLLADTFTEAEGCVALVDPVRLRSAINHLVQNAQDATADDGRIELSVTTRDQWVHIEITDNGEGMTEAFLRERLFSPFNTSKGVAGVGIGVYQAREVIRGFGGDLTVSSSRGRGSIFTIRLPHIDSSTKQKRAS